MTTADQRGAGAPGTTGPGAGSGPEPGHDDLAARLDRLPVITRTHRTWVVLLGALFVFDLVDLNSFAYAAPALRTQWGLSIGTVGLITSAGFVGMFLGAIVGGRLSDRIGRRPVLIGAVLFYSLFSLLSAASWDATSLGVMRVLTGFGLQAMTGVLLVYVSEMFPRALRGRYQSLLLAIGLAGVPIAAWLARIVVPLGPGTWRWVFVFGALGAIIGVIALRIMPESARWQAARGRDTASAERLVAKLEDEARARTGEPLPPVVPVPAVPPGTVRDLVRGPALRRTVVAAAACVFLILSFYGFSSWVPTFLVERGYSTAQALTYASVLAIAAVPGALLAFPFIDRWERKNLIFVLQVVVAALLLVFGLVGNPVSILVSGFLASMFMQTGVAVLYTYIAEVFPLALRGLGSGIANGTGRLAGVVGGVLVAAIFTGLGMAAVYVYLAAAALLMGLVLLFFGARTSNRGLEEIASDALVDETSDV
jgi:MFS transporter, putative metabolite:H+ symporter